MQRFLALEKDRPGAVIVQPSLPVKRVAELALKYRMPAISPFRPFVEEGGLVSYWFDEASLYRQTAATVDKVLRGAKPANLPVEQPTKFDLVINMKTAKAPRADDPAVSANPSRRDYPVITRRTFLCGLTFGMMSAPRAAGA